MGMSLICFFVQFTWSFVLLGNYISVDDCTQGYDDCTTSPNYDCMTSPSEQDCTETCQTCINRCTEDREYLTVEVVLGLVGGVLGLVCGMGMVIIMAIMYRRLP